MPPTILRKVCEHCHAEFLVPVTERDQRYCSRACALRAHFAAIRAEPDRICGHCKQPFRPRHHHHEFCSKRCHYRAHYLATRTLKPKVEKICPICRTRFETAREHQVTCSTQCKRRSDKLRQKMKKAAELKSSLKKPLCKFCGKALDLSKSWQTFCSNECAYLHKRKADKEARRYRAKHCADCGGEVEKGRKRCPACRATYEERFERSGYLPTEAEIAAACAEIRAGWSEYEHRKRAGANYHEWTPPEMVCLSEFVLT